MFNKNNIGVLIIGILLAFIFVFLQFPSVSIAKNIAKDSRFNYSTSLTGRYSNSEKANVYTTNMGVVDTAHHIIDLKKPESYTDLTNSENIQLFYDDYIVLVYKGEDTKTYVQISSRKYVHHNGYHSLYRPYHRNIIVFYDKSYRSRGYYRTDSNRYGGGYVSTSNTNPNKIRTNTNSSSKIRTKSVRSGSTGSRSSIGGGISFGK